MTSYIIVSVYKFSFSYVLNQGVAQKYWRKELRSENMTREIYNCPPSIRIHLTGVKNERQDEREACLVPLQLSVCQLDNEA